MLNRSICHDQRLWDDPDAFCPERFMRTGGSLASVDPFNVAFGHGRRSVCHLCIRSKSKLCHIRLCTGRLFADMTLFLAISSMAATLDICEARDGDGKEITPSASWSPSFIRFVMAHYMLSHVIADHLSAIRMTSCALLRPVPQRPEVL